MEKAFSARDSDSMSAKIARRSNLAPNNQQSLSVRTIHCGYSSAVTYDLNVILAIKAGESFRTRLEHFKKLGLINVKDRRAHVTLLLNRSHRRHCSELAAGWNGVPVSLLEMASPQPISKVNGFYLWLRNADLHSKWHLRVDDDSITDVDRLLCFAETRFGDAAIHLMASPSYIESGPPIFADYFAQHKMRIPTMAHEHKASLTSIAALEVVLNNTQACSFLEETGLLFERPADRALALAMHLCNVPTSSCSIMTKVFAQTEMSLTGGRYAHIQNVPWDNVEFTTMVAALLSGNLRGLRDSDEHWFVNRPLQFGRCASFPVSNLRLLDDGNVEGYTHPNEARWERRKNAIVFTRLDNFPTTVFSSVLEFGSNRWLFGPHLDEITYHYLREIEERL